MALVFQCFCKWWAFGYNRTSTAILLFFLLESSPLSAAFFDQYCADVQDWKARSLTNSGTISGKAYNAATECILFLQNHDLRRLIGRAGMYLGNNTQAMVCPVINKFPGGAVLGFTSDNLVANIGTNYFETTGMAGNGTTQYLDTGAGADTLGTGSDIHLAVYSRTSVYEVGGAIGSAQSAGYINYFLFGWVDNNCYMYMGAIADQLGVADPTPPTGFYLESRTSPTNRVVYKNGAALNSNVAASALLGNINAQTIFVHALNANGSINSPTTRRLSWYSGGKGIPASYQANYHIAVKRIQVIYNRQIP